MSEWFGELPARWDVRRAKTLFKKESRVVPHGADTVTCFRDGQVTLRKNRRTIGFTEAIQEFGYQGVCKGDLVIHVMDAFAGSIGVSDSDGKCTPVYSICTPLAKNANSYYYAYLLREMARAGWIQALYRGIRERSSSFTYDIFAAQSLPLPPRNEQDKIVRYLDWKVSRINKLVSAKRRQVALLQEQKRAVINAAVTKGGAGWEWHQLGKIVSIILSGLDKKTYEGQQAVKLCNYVDVYKNDYITGELPFMDATASDNEIANLKLQVDDVIITKDSESWDDIGVPAYVKEVFDGLCCGYHLAMLRSKKDIISGEFLYNAFRAQYVQIQHKIKANGITRFALGYQPIHDTQLFVPPLSEQHVIVAELDKKCGKIDRLIVAIQREIELFTEYKTRLISDVVTGKLDVRGVAVPEYDVVEETVDAEIIEEETEGGENAD
ncbi:hypothetical protein AGMMS49975_18090 [Clostridia bacterium]|nr:hypothetical protein AGMMS49975_18090 [Clostridia bacterium]